MKNNKEAVKGCIFLLCAFTLAGTSVISAKYVSEWLGTFTITILSLLFAILFLLPLCKDKLKDTFRRLHRKQAGLLVLQALFGIFLFRVFLLQGLNHTSAGEAGILTGSIPAITLVLALFILKEPLRYRGLIGITSTIAGILFIQGLFSGSAFTYGHFTGNLLVLCAAASEALFKVLSRLAHVKEKWGGNEPIDPVVQTFIVSAIALVFCIVPALFENPFHAVKGIGLREWLALLWYGVFVTGLAFICWYSGIKRCTASTAASFSGMMPFTSLMLSVLILGEKAGWQQWVGCTLILAGMILIGKSESDKPVKKETEYIPDSVPSS